MGASGSTVGPRAEEAPGVSFVIAALNERRNLPELIQRIRALALPAFEVIVVDDGSTDGTREYLEGEARLDPSVRPIFHDGRQTTLRAQCQGILGARGRFVVLMDGDLQHPPEVVPDLLRALEGGAALAVASRYAPGGSTGPRSALRGLISRSAEWTARRLLADARRSSDPVSGFFAFRKEVFQPLDPGYRGYKLLLFLLVMAHGRPVADVPFRFEPRTSGASKVTQGAAFVRVFLIELLLARRVASVLRADRRRAAGRPEAAPR